MTDQQLEQFRRTFWDSLTEDIQLARDRAIELTNKTSPIKDRMDQIKAQRNQLKEEYNQLKKKLNDLEDEAELQDNVIDLLEDKQNEFAEDFRSAFPDHKW